MSKQSVPNNEALTSRYEQLELALAGLRQSHAELLELAGEQREAIRAADGAALGRTVARQAEALERLAEFEQVRQAITSELSDGLPRRPAGAGPITVRELAGLAPEPWRTRLLEEAGALKTIVERLRDEHRTLRGATLSLLAHMEGLMRQVGRRLSHSGTYGRRGVVEAGATVISAVDVVL